MSGQPISLALLRELVDHDSHPHTQNIRVSSAELLALVEAVEAAQEVAEAWRTRASGSERTHDALDALAAALARFTDHKETRLCDCGRADVMDDRGLCGYCIEELDERHRNAEPEAPDGCP